MPSSVDDCGPLGSGKGRLKQSLRTVIVLMMAAVQSGIASREAAPPSTSGRLLALAAVGSTTFQSGYLDPRTGDFDPVGTIGPISTYVSGSFLGLDPNNQMAYLMLTNGNYMNQMAAFDLNTGNTTGLSSWTYHYIFATFFDGQKGVIRGCKLGNGSQFGSNGEVIMIQPATWEISNVGVNVYCYTPWGVLSDMQTGLAYIQPYYINEIATINLITGITVTSVGVPETYYGYSGFQYVSSWKQLIVTGPATFAYNGCCGLGLYVISPVAGTISSLNITLLSYNPAGLEVLGSALDQDNLFYYVLYTYMVSWHYISNVAQVDLKSLTLVNNVTLPYAYVVSDIIWEPSTQTKTN